MAEEVVRRQLRVPNRQGLHARPAARLVALANQFQCRIELIRGEQRVDAKGIMDLMLLAATEGTELLLEASGIDAAAAADTIEKFFGQELRDEDAQPQSTEP